MSWLIPLTLSCAAFAIVIEVAAWASHRRADRLILHAGLVALIASIAWLFMRSQGAPLLGAPVGVGSSFSVEWVIVLTFVGVLLGICGKYLFEAQNSFNWLDFLRPFAISPIVLLPLIGTLDRGDVQIVQMVSLFILGFQNGFFWQKVLQDVRITAKPAPDKRLI